jgi:potassium efflux system protein
MEALRQLAGERALEFAGRQYTFAEIVAALVTLGAWLLLAWGAEKAVRAGMRWRGLGEGLQAGVGRLVRYAGYLVAPVMALRALGMQVTLVVTLLLVVASALLVGVAFGLKNVSQNFVAGLIVLVEQPVRKGDFVQVDEVEGTVLAVGLRATQVETREGTILVVPNSKWVTEVVTNFSYPAPRQRCCVEVEVELEEDPDRVRRLLEAVAATHPRVLRAPAPEARLEALKGGNFTFALHAWVAEPVLGRRVASELRFALVEACRREGVALAQPALVIRAVSGTPPVLHA